MAEKAYLLLRPLLCRWRVWYYIRFFLTHRQPASHPERPIIVDEGVESPDTVTLRYEEEAVRVNGGDVRGGSPPDLLPMAAYKTQPAQLHGECCSSPILTNVFGYFIVQWCVGD